MSDISDWWSTEIIEMEPGSISLRGIPIKNLIGKKIILPLNFEEKIEVISTSEITKAPGFGFKFKILATFDNGLIREYKFKNYRKIKSFYDIKCDGGFFKKNRFIIWKKLEKTQIQ